jgi:hypothetical protein
VQKRAEAALIVVLALIGPAMASAQPARTEFEEAMGRPVRAPVVPPALRPMVREATTERLVVRGLGGGEIAVALGDIETERLAGFADGRYLGFHFNGYEFFGYRLVDRRMRGEDAVIETGEAPVFSPDGRHFAAVQVSGASFGNLEGLAIWRVEADRTVQILFTELLPQGEDWQIDGWPREDCISVSSIERQAQPGEPAPERRHFGVEVGETMRIRASGSFRGCNVTDATGND